jgi:hypothetical protein
MIRKRNDSVKPGAGIDGSKGEDFCKPHGDGQSEWYKTSDHPEGSYSRLDSDNGGDQWAEYGQSQRMNMRNTPDFGYSASVRDIFDDVQANDGPQGGFSAAIRAGVNRSQKR